MPTPSEKFDLLPLKIREWAASDPLTSEINEMNSRLKLPQSHQGAIAYLVLRLITRDLAPENLISEIMEQFGVNFEIAKKLALWMEDRLLKPVRSILKTELDIDIDLIKEGKEKPKVEEKKPIVSEMPAFIKKEVLRPAQGEALRLAQGEALRPAQGEMAPAPLPISEIKLPEAEKPFIIHEEKIEIKPTIPEAPKPTFTFKAKIPTPPSPPKPVTAKVETGNQ